MTIPIEDAKRKLPDGWHVLIDEIYELAANAGQEVQDIKDKMSWMRVNIRLTAKDYFKLISLEEKSHVTCMHCGRFGKLKDHYLVLCEDCHEMGVKIRYGKTFLPTENS